MGNRRQYARIAVLLTLAAVSVSDAAVDGTNIWTGASGGGSWKNPANWRAESAAGYTVEELFARYTVYDLRALVPGAVVEFDYADGNVYNVRDTTGAMFIPGCISPARPTFALTGDVLTSIPSPARVSTIPRCRS